MVFSGAQGRGGRRKRGKKQGLNKFGRRRGMEKKKKTEERKWAGKQKKKIVKYRPVSASAGLSGLCNQK